jgi:L-amino acid N-acyltransferase YncA
MEIRSAQVTDLASIDQIYTEGLATALAGEGATHPIRLWQMVTRTISSLLPLSIPTDMLYVLEEKGKVMGFIQAESLSSSDNPMARNAIEAVRVLNLSLSSELSGTGGGVLIDHLCGEALTRGAARIYVRIPDGHAVAESFKAHGFVRYANDRVFFRHSAEEPPAAAEVPGLRPARRKDAFGLFTLYLATTPKAVSQMEAPEFEQWRALHLNERMSLRVSEHMPRLGRRLPRNMVVERGGEIVGWLGIEPGPPSRPHTISMMARTEASPRGELQELLLGRALADLGGHPGAVWCNVRNYDTVTTRVLQDAGFEVLAGQDLLVRELRVRVPSAVRQTKKEKAMAPVFGSVAGL